MTHIGHMSGLPIACTLPFSAAKQQVEEWRAFDDEYAVEAERTDTRLTIHYAKVDNAIQRLHDLVAIERICCAFVGWSIDDTHADLRLIVTGTPFQLDALGHGITLSRDSSAGVKTQN